MRVCCGVVVVSRVNVLFDSQVNVVACVSCVHGRDRGVDTPSPKSLKSSPSVRNIADLKQRYLARKKALSEATH